MRKQIIIFWGQLLEDSKNPIRFEKKRETYLLLLQKLIEKDTEVYISRGINTYLGQNQFRVGWEYKNKQFKSTNKIIEPYSVYDRSGGLYFPNNLIQNVVNNIDFKLFAGNKWQAYTEFKEFFPNSLLIDTAENVREFISSYPPSSKFIVKPVNGMKGKDVSLFKSEDVEYILNNFAGLTNKFMIQEFIDTSNGIAGIIEGKHDLRVVCLNGKIIWSHVRSPGNKDDFKSNVAEGGSIDEIVDFGKLPSPILKIVNYIMPIFVKRFNNPLFTIDFGMHGNSAFIYEFNSQCGFPLPSMVNKELFIDNLVERLIN